jgi:hypothetical protein
MASLVCLVPRRRLDSWDKNLGLAAIRQTKIGYEQINRREEMALSVRARLASAPARQPFVARIAGTRTPPHELSTADESGAENLPRGRRTIWCATVLSCRAMPDRLRATTRMGAVIGGYTPPQSRTGCPSATWPTWIHRRPSSSSKSRSHAVEGQSRARSCRHGGQGSGEGPCELRPLP